MKNYLLFSYFIVGFYTMMHCAESTFENEYGDLKEGNASFINKLLAEMNKPDFQLPQLDVPQKPTLIEEAKKINVEAIRELLDAGADVNTKNEDGLTVLHALCDGYESLQQSFMGIGDKERKDAVDILHLIIEKGFDINQRNKQGSTPLLDSLIHKKVDTYFIQALIDGGADVNTCNEGLTPLSVVTLNHKKKALKVLIDAGVNVHTVHENGKKAIEFAENPTIKQMLRTAMRLDS